MNIVSIRDRKTISNDIDLSHIRESIIVAFDLLNSARTNSCDGIVDLLNRTDPHPESGIFISTAKYIIGSYPELARDAIFIPQKDSEKVLLITSDRLANIIALNHVTSYSCGLASNTALSYLRRNYPDQFALFRYKIEYGSKNFSRDHVMALALNIETQKHYIFSPANIFNGQSDQFHYHTDSKRFPATPQLNNKNFNRLTDIIICDSTEEMHEAVRELELHAQGGEISLKKYEVDDETYALIQPYKFFLERNNWSTEKINMEDFIDSYVDESLEFDLS
jgi:hypothetical protein